MLEDEFDFLRLAEAENETLRMLLDAALARLPVNTDRELRKSVQEALAKKPVKTAWRLGIEAAIQHLRQCQQAEEEATHNYLERDFVPESKVSYEYARAYGIALSELEKWLNT
jgi:hypothetical protein